LAERMGVPKSKEIGPHYLKIYFSQFSFQIKKCVRFTFFLSLKSSLFLILF